mmetsp:Transcript_95741/g.265852  ORF Transcript_95741/g.265852 Transcript_95741/m.265852 type:complete len:344 (-) Transcript_95741:174-1205(-)
MATSVTDVSLPHAATDHDDAATGALIKEAVAVAKDSESSLAPEAAGSASHSRSASEDKAPELEDETATSDAGVPASERLWHGARGRTSWKRPRCTARSSAEARPGYDSMDASEYHDDAATLDAKVDVLVSMLRAAKACVVYTGAGISTAAGIGDYASKAKGSAIRKLANASLNRKAAEPTHAHRVLAALAKRTRKGPAYVHQWVNQNHDGLAQKAGFPMSMLNEIHGSWFDSRNRVKMMDDSLRPDLLERMVEWSERADLCLAMGTSLCGMNADRVATTPGEKALAGEAGALGMVIVNLQRTACDNLASLRIYATCDEVMRLVQKKMRLRISKDTLPQSRWVK